MTFPILSTLIFLPLISSFFILLSKDKKTNNGSIYISLFSSFATFMLSLFLWYSLDLNTSEFYENIKQTAERGGIDDSGFGRQISAILGSKNRLNKVRSINQPTLIIHGKDDPLINVKNAYKANSLIKNSTLKIIPNMRHLIEIPVFDQFKNDLLLHLNKKYD